MRDKLLIFDMDNTVLQSRLNFPLMKETVHRVLDEYGFSEYKLNTTAKSILAYENSNDCRADVLNQILDEIKLVEKDGLENAVLEPGAKAALSFLQPCAILVLLTNNDREAAMESLKRLGADIFFDDIVGRDGSFKLKPEPDGVNYILDKYSFSKNDKVLVVGDAWNDAMAAAAAGVGFVAYNNSRSEDWDGQNIKPLLRLDHWDDDACKSILALLGN